MGAFMVVAEREVDEDPVRQIGRTADLDAGAKRKRPEGVPARDGWHQSLSNNLGTTVICDLIAPSFQVRRDLNV